METPPPNAPAPEPASPPPAVLPPSPPNEALILIAHQLMNTAFTEPERIKSATAIEKAKIESNLSKHGLYVTSGIIVLLVAVSAMGFSQGDKEILRQCLTGVFAFMAGLGFARFMPGKG